MNDRTKHIFADRQTLIVSMAEIKELMSMEECLELQKQVFVAHVQGGAQNAPNTWLRLIGQNKWMKLLAGYVGDIDTMGMKVLARFPENPPGMNIGSLVALFDGKDGFPMAIMDAVYFTAVRTAAGGGLSVLYCARKDSTSVGIVGSGVQARYNLIAMKQVLPQLSDARVYSRSQERRESFAEKMQQEIGIQMAAVGTVEEAVADMDIILMGTNSPEPVLMKEMVTPGVHIAAMGIKTEIEPAAFKGARVIGDGRQVTIEDGKFSVGFEAGILSESDLAGEEIFEIGDVILGKTPGRLSDADVTIFDSSGLAVQDVICAHHCYQKAKKVGKGTWVDLGLGELP